MSLELSEPRTAQWVFDTVVNHLRKQGCRSYRHQGVSCAYRGQDGSKCAAGVLIPDNEYMPVMEGSTAAIICVLYLVGVTKEMFNTHSALISDLQCIHDMHDVDKWEDSFRRFAKWHDCVYTPLSE